MATQAKFGAILQKAMEAVPTKDAPKTNLKERATQGQLATNNCQLFFRNVGAELHRQGMKSWTQDLKVWDHVKQGRTAKENTNVDADEIAHLIDRDSRGWSPNWRKLEGTYEEVTANAQRLANEGAVVVGCSRRRHGGKDSHGHLAFVTPTPPGVNLADHLAHGPMMRDGNEHRANGRAWSTSWGAAPASKVWKGDQLRISETGFDQVKWFVWIPSIPTGAKLHRVGSAVHKSQAHK